MRMFFSRSKSEGLEREQAELLAKLQEHDVFTGLPAGKTDKLVPALRFKHFRDEDIVCHCPDATHDLFILLKGRVGLTFRRGAERHSLELLEPEAVFNIEALVGGERSDMGARALGEVEVLHIDSQWLLEVMEQDPTIGYIVLRNMSRILVSQHFQQLQRLLD